MNETTSLMFLRWFLNLEKSEKSSKKMEEGRHVKPGFNLWAWFSCVICRYSNATLVKAIWHWKWIVVKLALIDRGWSNANRKEILCKSGLVQLRLKRLKIEQNVRHRSLVLLIAYKLTVLTTHESQCFDKFLDSLQVFVVFFFVEWRKHLRLFHRKPDPLLAVF